MRILILCTGNSCRSQMAQAYLQSLDANITVLSAGTNPATYVHPIAINVMNEIGLDISHNRPKNVNMYLNQTWDYVITVCGGAKESCPIFKGNVLHRIHIGFDDPAAATGTDSEILNKFRQIRDEIKLSFSSFYQSKIKQSR